MRGRVDILGPRKPALGTWISSASGTGCGLTMLSDSSIIGRRLDDAVLVKDCWEASVRRILRIGIVSLLFFAHTTSPLLASSPHDAGVRCRQGHTGELYISPDGEVWVCSYDERLDLYYWHPIPPPAPDEESDDNAILPTTEEDVHFIVSRIEWIRGSLYTGGDTYVRRPQTVPLYKDTGQIAVFTRLWWWNGGGWQHCGDSGWGAHTNAAGAWLLCGPVWSGYVYVSGSASPSSIPQSSTNLRPPATRRPDRLPPVRPVYSPGGRRVPAVLKAI